MVDYTHYQTAETILSPLAPSCVLRFTCLSFLFLWPSFQSHTFWLLLTEPLKPVHIQGQETRNLSKGGPSKSMWTYFKINMTLMTVSVEMSSFHACAHLPLNIYRLRQPPAVPSQNMPHRTELSPLTLLSYYFSLPTIDILWVFFVVLDNIISHLSIKKKGGGIGVYWTWSKKRTRS